MQTERHETKGRLLAKLAWELLKTAGPFASVADLTDAVKTRCARLRIAWTNEDLVEAYWLIESNTPLVQALRTPPTEADLPAPLSESESRAALQRIRERLGITPTMKTLPAVRQLTNDEIRQRHRTDDQRRAYRQLQAAIRDQAERVAALEDETP